MRSDPPERTVRKTACDRAEHRQLEEYVAESFTVDDHGNRTGTGFDCCLRRDGTQQYPERNWTCLKV